MGKRPSFTKAELIRAISAAKAAGIAVTRCEINRDGSIVLSAMPADATATTEYDAWKASQP